MPGIVFGQGNLGIIHRGRPPGDGLPNGDPDPKRYQLDWNDLLWLGRMLSGETGTGDASYRLVEYSALCWCYAQMTAFSRNAIGWDRPTVYNNQVSSADAATLDAAGIEFNNDRTVIQDSSFTTRVQLHSQPINPRWRRGGEFCRLGGRNANEDGSDSAPVYSPGHRWAGQHKDACSPTRLDRRDEFATKAWGDMRDDIKEFLVSWARGGKENVVPGYIDFAAYGLRPDQENGNRGPEGNTPPLYGGLTFGGNTFYKHWNVTRLETTYKTDTTNWPPRYVYIEYNGHSSGESAPEVARRVFGTGESIDTQRRALENRRREELITTDREGPDSVSSEGFKRDYWTLSGSSVDPQSRHGALSEEQESILIKTAQKRFFDQVNALKDASTLEIAQAVPVLEIKTQNEDGKIVSLNKLIFGLSPFNELLNPEKAFLEELPERPIASIVGLSFNIQTPSVGGAASIMIGTLDIKVHNPGMVHRDHPRGKYISYMMRMGFYLRIRFGTEGPAMTGTAFQTLEQDFFVSQHDVNINDDKTYDLKLTIMPASHKLLNQMHIGESIPFGDLNSNGQAITEEDVRNVIETQINTIDADDATAEELDFMRTQLRNFAETFNQGAASDRDGRSSDSRSDSPALLGSVLHGAITQTQITNEPEGQRPIIVRNMVDSLRTLQSVLLTRRIESMLEEDAYMYSIKGIRMAVISFGPLFYKMILPEFEQIALLTSQNNLRVGEEYSSDNNGFGEETNPRTKVMLIFGNFNQWAGQWGNRPISQIPINANVIFGYLRERRNVGDFSGAVNAFISRLNTIINEPENFIVSRQDDRGRPLPLERPQIKYTFYPHPQLVDTWILYIYDSKYPLVVFSNVLRALDRDPTKEQIIERLDHYDIPWMEMGHQGSLIKTMSAKTQGDDLVMTHNMIEANRLSMTTREVDATHAFHPGMSREWFAGAQLNPQNAINSTTLILPVEISATTYMITSAFLFAPIYLFMPTKMFSGLYQPYVLTQEINDGKAETVLTLQINITQANRIAQ